MYGVGVTLAPDRFTDQPDYASALRAYEAEPRVRVLFDVGGGGTPLPAFSTTATSFPLPGTTPTTFYFGADGALTAQPPSTTGASDSYRYDPAAFPATDHGSDGGSQLTPTFDWKPVPAGKALAYVTEPLAANAVMVGTGSVDLWLQSTKPDVDVEVTISEVRPDGQETYVQSGWLRASQRALDTKTSTPLLPVQTHTRARRRAAPRGEGVVAPGAAVPVRAHVPRRIPHPHRRATARGEPAVVGVRRAAVPTARVTNRVERSRAHASKVVLPLVGGVDVTTPLPPCGSLRGQPCRTYVPLDNQSAAGGAS